MWFVLIGTLLVVLKLAGVAPVAGWSWFIVLIPFGLAVLWWAWADKSGLTQRQAMQRLDERKEQRRKKAMEALGQGEQRRK